MDDPERQTTNDHFAVFLVVFAVVGLANSGVFAISWAFSEDVRGFWPVIVVLLFLGTLMYAGLYGVFTRASFAGSWQFAIVYNLLLAVALLAHTMLFYAIRLDPQDASNHSPTLLYRVVHSDLTVYAAYGAFLLGAFFVGRRYGITAKNRASAA